MEQFSQGRELLAWRQRISLHPLSGLLGKLTNSSVLCFHLSFVLVAGGVFDVYLTDGVREVTNIPPLILLGVFAVHRLKSWKTFLLTHSLSYLPLGYKPSERERGDAGSGKRLG